MVIDDLANRSHDCDLLLDQNWFENMKDRYNGFVPIRCTKLLGPKYALLRPEFIEERKKVKPHPGVVKRVFVFFGGSDPRNLTGKTLKILSEPELTHLCVDVVVGVSNPNLEEIKKLVAEHENTQLHIQVDDIAPIMGQADIAIGSGGVNTWERACLGLPSITVSFSDNHQLLLRDLAANNYITYLGSAATISNEILKENLISKMHSQDSLKNESIRVAQLTNGKGRIYVADKLMATPLSISIVSDQA